MLVVGVGYSLVETAGLTLMQRLASDEVLGRVFGVVESTYVASTGIGAAVAPLLISLLGIRGALAVVGAALPLLAIVRWRTLARYEAGAPIPERQFELLRGVPLFAPLPVASVENLALRLSPVRRRRRRGGDPPGRRRRPLLRDRRRARWRCSSTDGTSASSAAGEFFGEIALLQRLAAHGHRAGDDARRCCYALESEEFIASVTGNLRAFQAAGERDRRAAVRRRPCQRRILTHRRRRAPHARGASHCSARPVRGVSRRSKQGRGPSCSGVPSTRSATCCQVRSGEGGVASHPSAFALCGSDTASGVEPMPVRRSGSRAPHAINPQSPEKWSSTDPPRRLKYPRAMTDTVVNDVTWDLDHLVDGGGPEACDRYLAEADERAAAFASRHAGGVAAARRRPGWPRRWPSSARSPSSSAAPATTRICASPPTPRTRPTAH